LLEYNYELRVQCKKVLSTSLFHSTWNPIAFTPWNIHATLMIMFATIDEEHFTQKKMKT